MRSYYDVLGVEQDADHDELQAAYRSRYESLRSDQRGEASAEGVAESEESMRELVAAWTVLGDPSARARYDRSLDHTATASPSMARNTRNGLVALLVIIGVIIGGVVLILGGGDEEEPTATTVQASQGVTPSTSAQPGTTAGAKRPVQLPPAPSGGSVKGDTACPGSEVPPPRAVSFEKPPPLCINPAKTYTAEMLTTKGLLTIALDAKAASKTVNNFVVLSRYSFYDGIAFHRIIPGFVIVSIQAPVTC